MTLAFLLGVVAGVGLSLAAWLIAHDVAALVETAAKVPAPGERR